MDANPVFEKNEKKYFKHIGELQLDHTPVVILFRTVPGQPEQCLIVGPKFLPDIYREVLMRTVENSDAQSSFELGVYLSNQKFADGDKMLAYLHYGNYIKKFFTKDVIVTYGPGKEGKISLDKLNELIAKDMGVSLNELSVKDDKIKIPIKKNNKKNDAKETAKN